MAALERVKSRAKAEIEGDDETMHREEEEEDRYKQEWLAEFERIRAENDIKWQTCTYTADEFCGLLFHSADIQQKAQMLREYPTIMSAWRDTDLALNSRRVRRDWPVASVAHSGGIRYSSKGYSASGITSSSSEDMLASNGMRLALSRHKQPIQPSSSLYTVLQLLRTEFMWCNDAITELTLRLEAMQIYCCQDLLSALQHRSGAYFERSFQSTAYPRLSKAMCDRLAVAAQEQERRHESLRGLCMDAMPVNQQ